MKIQRLLVCILLAAPALSYAASKEIVDLQRDVALLQQQLRDLQRSQDEKLAALTELTRQAVEGSGKANTNTAIIQSSIGKTLDDMKNQVVTPVVGINTRMDNLSNDIHTLQQALSDMAATMSKMQSQLTDISQQVQAMAKPIAPPPQGGATPGAPGGADAGGPPPIPATDLYNNAMRDKGSGKLDLAVQEFSDYLKWYPTGDLAPNCQFYIGIIHYGQGNYEAAAKDFDAVLEHYQENAKTREAQLYKGRALVHMQGHRTEGADEFAEVIRRYPGTDEAHQACTERQALGLRCGGPPAAPSRTANKKGSKR